MFKLLDKLSVEMGIECTSMSGLIQKFNDEYKDLEDFYIGVIVDLANQADVVGFIEVAEMFEEYKKQLSDLDPKT